MGWLEEREIEYLYRSECGQELVIETAKEAPKEFEQDGIKYFYKEMLPYKCNMMVKIAYEQNGLKAYQIRHGDAKPHYVSATALQHERLHGGKSKKELRGATVEQVYSKPVQKMKDQQKLAAEKAAKKKK